MPPGHTVFEARSPFAGRVRVIDRGSDRLLIVGGDTLSVYPLNGDWSRFHREYWWQALATATLPRRPSALLVGLGGGTQVHLLRALTRPRLITVIERDPVIMRVAFEWFGLAPLGPLECHCGDAAVVARALIRARRRFGFIMEDSAYAAPLEESRALVEMLADLVSPGGMLVVNRHRRGDGHHLAALLRPLFTRVWQKRVRREGENVLVFAEGRGRNGPGNAGARRDD